MWDESNGSRWHNEKWVEVGTFQGSVFAEMAKEMLRQNDIPCFLKKAFLSSAYGIHSTTNVGMTVKVMVPESRKAESRDILAMISDEWDE